MEKGCKLLDRTTSLTICEAIVKYGRRSIEERIRSRFHRELDAYDFAGKKIVPFCTSGGNGIGETAKRIQEIVGTAATVEEGTRLGGTVSEKDLETWTAGLGL